MAPTTTARRRPVGARDERHGGQRPGDRTLRYAAILFAAGLALHTADHLRRGPGTTTQEVFWAGMVVTVAGIIAIAAVLTRHRLAPAVAAVVGFATAIGVSASHLLPRWSDFSDAFPGGAVDALSWTVVSLEIAGAFVLGAAALNAGQARRRAR